LKAKKRSSAILIRNRLPRIRIGTQLLLFLPAECDGVSLAL
jgi:hypothetical protein